MLNTEREGSFECSIRIYLITQLFDYETVHMSNDLQSITLFLEGRNPLFCFWRALSEKIMGVKFHAQYDTI